MHRRAFVSALVLSAPVAGVVRRAGAQTATAIKIGTLPPADICAESYYGKALGMFAQTVAQIQSVRRVSYGEAIAPSLIQPPIDVAVKYGLLSERYAASDLIANL